MTRFCVRRSKMDFMGVRQLWQWIFLIPQRLAEDDFVLRFIEPCRELMLFSQMDSRAKKIAQISFYPAEKARSREVSSAS